MASVHDVETFSRIRELGGGAAEFDGEARAGNQRVEYNERLERRGELLAVWP